MISAELLNGEVRKIIESVGGKLNTPEDVAVAFDYVEASLEFDLAKLRVEAMLQCLLMHFKLVAKNTEE